MTHNSSQKSVFLHGDLDLKILEARNLPNMDMVSERFRQCLTVFDTCRTPSVASPEDGNDGNPTNSKIKHHHKIITSDPYVVVSVPGSTIVRTRVISNSQNPVWDERFSIPMAYPAENLEFQVKDNDLFGAELIGTVRVSAEEIRSGKLITGWFSVIGTTGKPPKQGAKLHLEMKFIPFDQNPLYRRNIAADSEPAGVRRSYFPLRRGGSVTLYQDAHVSDGILPEIALDGGRIFTRGKCWEDICYAISEAQKLIYIVGWSVFHKVRLIREPSRPLPPGGDLTLGELLKYKSQEGVRVLLLVWDDKTSHSRLFINTEGVMQTHDEETRKFFKHSSVICVLSPRYASSKLSYMKQKIVGTLFTHHQKCVLVDTQADANTRKITAFIGGIDLCDGRYDTPEHRIFRNLNTVFKDDFHNPTFSAGTKAPRQPWHDLHCRIEGPAAYDVLINFEQRWRKATKWTQFGVRVRKVSHRNDDALLKIERISWMHTPELSIAKDGTYNSVPKDSTSLWVSREDSPETWHVQIFRSIDSGSVKGFPKTVDLAKAQNLACSKNLVIDQSIHTAYVQAIRSAQRFIYIENQYFLGSSHAWPSYENAGADNLVPIELALKIASKIRARERFAVYIVIPMWPEGDPKSASVQEILFWQNQTMQMMYSIVAQELRSMQLDSHPLDYLNFYCLGNREEVPEAGSDGANGSSENSNISAAQKYRRFMIYVHAKGMIIDDEYIIIGSANINQRSMAGTKDTEIAMGAYQPHQTSAVKRRPSGQIYGYRISLWAEHLGQLSSFDEPESLECVRRVNDIATSNWQKYTTESFTTLQGHLLKYPIQVDAEGKVSSLPGHETFPDVGGKVLGAPSPTLPDTLTT